MKRRMIALGLAGGTLGSASRRFTSMLETGGAAANGTNGFE